MPKASRRHLPDDISEGQPLDSWLFLGWRIDRVLTHRDPYPAKHVFNYVVTPYRPLPRSKPGRRLPSMADAMAYILTYHGLATASCDECFQTSRCKAGWLHGPATSSRSTQLRLGTAWFQREKHQKNRLKILIPKCPNCGARAMSNLQVAVDASPNPLGARFTVVRDGVTLLMRVASDGTVQFETLGPVEPGKPQLVGWRGYH